MGRNYRHSAPSEFGIVTNDSSAYLGKVAVGSSVSFGLEVAQGDVGGTSFIHKFGKAPDFDINDGFVTVWDGSDDGDIDQTIYQYSTTADIDTISSSSASDVQVVEIQGLDSNFLVNLQTATLAGQASTMLVTPLVRVFRMKNIDSSNINGHAYCYVNTTATAGVPDEPTFVRAIMQPDLNQTLMAVYTVPAGKTAYMSNFYFGVAGAIKTSAHVMHLIARPDGQVFQIKHASSVIADGTSHFQHFYDVPEVFQEKTDIEMQSDTDTNVAAVAGGFDLTLVDN